MISRLPLWLLHISMRNMWFDLLDDTIDEFPYARANDCIIENHPDLLRHLVDTGRVDLARINRVCPHPSTGSTIQAMQYVSRNGYFDVFKILHKSKFHRPTKDAMDHAAGQGHLEIVKFIHENRVREKLGEDGTESFDHLSRSDRLYALYHQGCTSAAMDRDAANGHLDVVKYLHENRTEGCTTDAMDDAARDGNLKLVKWLHAIRTEGCTVKAVVFAVQGNHTKIVRFLLNDRSEGFSDDTIIHCKNPEIIEMLVASLSDERKRVGLKKAISRDMYGPAIDTLRKSLGVTVV